MREHAGVLSTQAWLSRFPTTADQPQPASRLRRVEAVPRHRRDRARGAADRRRRQFQGARPSRTRPARCATTRSTRWRPASRTGRRTTATCRSRTRAAPITRCPPRYRSGNYPKDANNQAVLQDAATTGSVTRRRPATAARRCPVASPATRPRCSGWAQQVAADARYALGAVHFWYKAVFGREPLKAPLDATTPENAGPSGRLQRAERGTAGDRRALQDRSRRRRLQRQGPARGPDDEPWGTRRGARPTRAPRA